MVVVVVLVLGVGVGVGVGGGVFAFRLHVGLLVALFDLSFPAHQESSVLIRASYAHPCDGHATDERATTRAEMVHAQGHRHHRDIYFICECDEVFL